MNMNNGQLPAIVSDQFSLQLYEQTLEKAKRLGYVFPTVSELKDSRQKPERFLLIRHDVDSSPWHALAMAEIEHRLGIRSSYFILMHCPFYNPGAPPHWDYLRKIIDLGFEVGLHYDTEFFEKRGMDPLEGVLGDAAALESILRIKIVSVSQHRPASGTFLKRLNEFYVDAYNEDLVHNLCYISDSGFRWRGKSLADLLGEENRIHALIHPLTWSYADLDMAGTYRRIAEEIGADVRKAFEEFIESTSNYLARREQLDAARRAQYLSGIGNTSR